MFIFSFDLFIKYHIVRSNKRFAVVTLSKRSNFPLFYCHVIIKFRPVNNSVISAKNLLYDILRYLLHETIESQWYATHFALK